MEDNARPDVREIKEASRARARAHTHRGGNGDETARSHRLSDLIKIAALINRIHVSRSRCPDVCLDGRTPLISLDSAMEYRRGAIKTSPRRGTVGNHAEDGHAGPIDTREIKDSARSRGARTFGENR